MARTKIEMGPPRMVRLDLETEEAFKKAYAQFQAKLPGVSAATVIRTLLKTGAAHYIALKEDSNV